MQAKHADVCSGVLFELRARATRTCCHCHLAVKNPIHDGKRSQLKLPKSHEGYHNVVMWHWIGYKWRRSKKMLSFHRIFFNLLDFTVSLSCRDCHSEIPWPLFKSARWYVLSGTGFLVAHQLYIGNVMREGKIGKSSPHQHLSFQCLGVIVALNGKSASMLLEPTKNKLKQWLVIEKSVNKCNFFPDILKF